MPTDIAVNWPLIVQTAIQTLGIAATFVVALLTWRNARRAAMTAAAQHRTAENKLRLDLYEKRFAIYQSTKSSLYARHDITNEKHVDLVRRCDEAADTSTFLFGDEVFSFLMDVRNELSTFRHLMLSREERKETMTPEDWNVFAHQHDIATERLDKMDVTLWRVFKPYLEFDKIKA